MGGMSEEREISLRTGQSVLNALLEKGYNVVSIDAGRDLFSRIVAEGVEVAFIALHGRYGEDGCVQGALELMGIPYTGSGVRASSLAMDKVAAKKIFAYHGLPTPAFALAEDFARKGKKLKMPLIVKPASQGSAIGVSVVRKRAALKRAVEHAKRFGSPVLIEEFIEGRELTVSILDGKALPIIEIRPKEGPLYDYEAKYTLGKTEFIVPAPLKRVVREKVAKAALGAYNALGCADAARVDVMLSRDGVPYVLEVNTVPGLTSLSLFPKAAASAGIGYAELVERILKGASAGKD